MRKMFFMRDEWWVMAWVVMEAPPIRDTSFIEDWEESIKSNIWDKDPTIWRFWWEAWGTVERIFEAFWVVKMMFLRLGRGVFLGSDSQVLRPMTMAFCRPDWRWDSERL